MRRLTGLSVVLSLSSSIPALIRVCQLVIQAITANATLYPNLPIALAVLAANLATLAELETQAQAKHPGAAEERDVQAELVIANFKQTRAYVEALVIASPGQAAVLVDGAAMRLRKVRSYKKPPLAAKQGGVSGLVLLFCLASKIKAVYGWQVSSDQKTWLDLPPTTAAKTSEAGLTPGITYYFRQRPIIKGVAQDWGQIIAFLAK